ncbi:MAG: hypothetical protein H6624_04620 [Bdellovibrionaceae bacterium]|nr:hypothetical protein [Bdellovibrionales bacterium]MCB9083601.1 hypothetical protein [Pseudobdellovibrionaceae bacterium]
MTTIALHEAMIRFSKYLDLTWGTVFSLGQCSFDADDLFESWIELAWEFHLDNTLKAIAGKGAVLSPFVSLDSSFGRLTSDNRPPTHKVVVIEAAKKTTWELGGIGFYNGQFLENRPPFSDILIYRENATNFKKIASIESSKFEFQENHGN